ncbi:MAG: hypothetical protein LW595_05940 [Rickettsiales bacterium]|nr:hypothetical protein [Rickettsiales bacterium]
MKNSADSLKKHWEQTSDGTYLSKLIIGGRNLLDGTYASKGFDLVFLKGKQEEFQSSKNNLKEINQKFFEQLLEASKKDEEKYNERKNDYLSKLKLSPDESKVAGQVYDELYQAQLKKILKEECEEYEKKAKEFSAIVEKNLENANKEASPSHPDMVFSAVLMMTPFGLFAVFDYFDQLQQVYEVVKPAIDGLQTVFENVPFIGDLMKEFYGISGSEVGRSASAFVGSLSNDFLLKSAISYFATERMTGKLIDPYDNKKQNFDLVIKKVEKFNSALTNDFNTQESGIANRALEKCGLDDKKNYTVIKEAIQDKQKQVRERKENVKSFNQSFFSSRANDQQQMIKNLLKFDPAKANDEQKKAFIEKAWIVFFAEKDSDIESSRGKIKSDPKSVEENSGDNYFNQLSISQELQFAKKLSQIGISCFEEELKNLVKDLRLIQGKAMLVGGLQNDSAEFLANFLPNQNIEILDNKDFKSKTLEDGKIYETRLQKLNPQDLDKMSALILHEKIKDGGHYTALIKQKIIENGQEKIVWFHYNDDKVIEIKEDEQMKSILANKTVVTIVNSNELPIATKLNGKINPAFSGLKNTGNSCFANSAVVLISSLPENSVVKEEFIKNLDKVGIAPDLEANPNKLNISQFQNNFIANQSAQNVVDQIYKINKEPLQGSQIITGKQQSTGQQK